MPAQIGRLGGRGFQLEMRGAALTSLNEQFPFDQIKEVSVRGIVGHIEGLAAPTAGDRDASLVFSTCFCWDSASVTTISRITG